ncbi:MAG: dynamin family protein [Acidobacteriota bacterium]|nr:dynamin family protein [Acidobacteriota bacterium]
MTTYRLAGDRWLRHARSDDGPSLVDDATWRRLTAGLRQLAGALRGVEPAWAEEVEGLVQDDGAVGGEGATLVFGGHFKSGKSTLLNALLGREILPVDALPETGALCSLGSAAADRGEVFRNGDRYGIACETDSIRREVALLDEAGQQRPEIEAVDRVELDLAGVEIPSGQRWIDSPGINDTKAMNHCARRAVRRGDVLLWILTSKQMLSEVEVAFLAEEIAYSGPASVVFVLNFFLQQDGEEEWRRGLERQLPFLLEKLSELSPELGFTAAQPPTVAAVAGRALGVTGNGAFGGADLRRLVLHDAAGIGGRRDRVRAHRLLVALRALEEELGGRVEAEEKALETARQEARARRAAAEADGKRLRRELDHILSRLKGDWSAGVREVADALVRGISDPLQRDDTYTDRLNRALKILGEGTRKDFFQAVAGALERNRHTELPQEARRQIRRSLTAPKLRVEVADNAPDGGTWLGGAAAGAAAGTVVPIIGTLFGAVAGAAAGAGYSARKALEKDFADTRAAARRAALSVEDLADEKAREIRRLILGHCGPSADAEAGAEPVAAAAARLGRLEEVAELLAKLREQARKIAEAPL